MNEWFRVAVMGRLDLPNLVHTLFMFRYKLGWWDGFAIAKKFFREAQWRAVNQFGRCGSNIRFKSTSESEQYYR